MLNLGGSRVAVMGERIFTKLLRKDHKLRVLSGGLFKKFKKLFFPLVFFSIPRYTPRLHVITQDTPPLFGPTDFFDITCARARHRRSLVANGFG
jgi:hypothetical protein